MTKFRKAFLAAIPPPEPRQSDDKPGRDLPTPANAL
jgi:hypothetical protein